jgi:hypothetical protein
MPRQGDILHAVQQGRPAWGRYHEPSRQVDGHFMDPMTSHDHPYDAMQQRWRTRYGHFKYSQVVEMDDPEPANPVMTAGDLFAQWLARYAQPTEQDIEDTLLGMGDPTSAADGQSYTSTGSVGAHTMFVHPNTYADLVGMGMDPGVIAQTAPVVGPDAFDDIIASTQAHLSDIIARGEVGQIFGVQAYTGSVPAPRRPRRRRIRRPRGG